MFSEKELKLILSVLKSTESQDSMTIDIIDKICSIINNTELDKDN